MLVSVAIRQYYSVCSEIPEILDQSLTKKETIQILRGSSALSRFRKNKICDQLKQVFSDLRQLNNLTAEYYHFAQFKAPITKSQSIVLDKVLSYGPSSSQKPVIGTLFLVVPRLGTISPWSTKATDILHHCGLEMVTRVERGMAWWLPLSVEQLQAKSAALAGILYDPMTESMLYNWDQVEQIFITGEPAPLLHIDILAGGIKALAQANGEFGFALSDVEQHYLYQHFKNFLGRNPTDVELMMFAQVNSEHCRHKIFNANWTIDGDHKDASLFAMIQQTHELNPQGTLVAYHDNAAILTGSQATRWMPSAEDRVYRYHQEEVHIAAKVETHNHPTAISPFAGAATGSGGEIRDEGATGIGGKPKAGICGFSVSQLHLPDMEMPWELTPCKPDRIATPLQIMLDGPIGAAAFNNEFGRPNIAGYFRSFEQLTESKDNRSRYGYHKPIMLAGGLGNVRPMHVNKQAFGNATPIVVLGGPTMLIGLGGGAASSMASGTSCEQLDFASVQRGNPEMQRRCQEVIDACCALGEENPLQSIHDVGAGGVSNALPELIHDAGLGGRFELRAIINDEPSMSPLQIWCNESQERYVLAIKPEHYRVFTAICQRERCLYARVGEATSTQKLLLEDQYFNASSSTAGVSHQTPIDLPMEVLFGLPPKMQRDVTSTQRNLSCLQLDSIDISESVKRVLMAPTVADKTFLVTIGDRSVSGLISRDQMVGPWQVPVADVGVCSSDYLGYHGEAITIGERTPLALINAPASGRMAIGEALTNLAAAEVIALKQVKLSANWMVAAGAVGQDAELYETVRAIATELCPALGISIPVGKDSMSMRTLWGVGEEACSVTSPLSLLVTAFAAVKDVRKTLTPQLRTDLGDTDLWLIDLGQGKNRLGGSILAQVYDQLGDECPDLDDADLFCHFFATIQALNQAGYLLAYHDRSDGGLIATICEMAFSARCGLSIDLGGCKDVAAALFSEELGAVIQTRRSQRSAVKDSLYAAELGSVSRIIGQVDCTHKISITANQQPVLDTQRTELHRYWSKTSWKMQSIRDHPQCAQQEYDRILDLGDPGLHVNLSFDQTLDICASMIMTGARPAIAILREQGVNGQLEMAAAFDRAGFNAFDVTMSDLLERRHSLTEFKALAACGGFSFGDVLGAGEGWGKSILFNTQLADEFKAFFERSDSFALGVCNGCQMLSTIKAIIPGADLWPRFVRNRSEQYEARSVMTEVIAETSILFTGMSGSRIAISVAHGEGRAEFSRANDLKKMEESGLVVLRYVDNHGQVSEVYPYNVSGSPVGVNGFTNTDGRFTIMMPHPERVFRSVAHSWHPPQWGEDSPWMRLFHNARYWLG